jgi:hypothetical protein
MGRLKEELINNLTDEEIDEIYEELINAEYFYIDKEDEQKEGKISGTTSSEGGQSTP